MKPIKKIVITLIFLMGFLVGNSQQKKENKASSSPAMGETSKSTIKRLATTVEPNRKFSYPERELDYLMHIWKGEYDNVEQLDFDKIQKLEGKKHDRVHVSIRQFQNSNFGVGAVYVEEYREDNVNIITRQCIYQLVPDDKENAIKVKVYHFKTKKPILAKRDSFKAVSVLTPNSNLLKEGCSMILRRNGDGFLAKTILDSCTDKQVKEYQFSVTENSFHFTEEGIKTAYQLEKARCFTCMIDFPNDTNGRSTVTNHYIDILDQGGSFKFKYPDGRNMLLGMRNTWSFGMHRETFVIYILDQETNKTLIYSWGNPGADRIGFNPGWIRVQCDLKTPRNVKMQQELRPGS
ncbi:CpeT/CpcT family protein DUF1001 [Maribacter vaceletii]|uniref:CpeT/CpcT family protein DUF1001 n=1 Tax=Maribacter vaceletii TaxID=1206816 RepID=A0A495EEC6_9FLAO|nr:CpcT/CpeT family chromophore lyase [Maribacter vaceletii]RKR15235.1 CpeT/CpcT family protein DUF1001 [Maribacter vaceletii]